MIPPSFRFVFALALVPAHAVAQGAEPPAPTPAGSATGALPPQPAAPPGPPPAAPATAAPPAPPPPGTPPAGPPPATPAPGYPPPGGYEQYPPPGYYYPPPGYYYPPPGYGWGPPPKPKPVYPEDAAGQTTPFIDILTAGVSAGERYSHFFTVGVQGGAYLASRFRLVGRVLLFTTEPADDVADRYDYSGSVLPDGYIGVSSERPIVLVGGAVGIAPVVRTNFVFAPGLAFHTTNVGDYGSMLTLSMPFDWVTDDGMRIGFEIDVGRAFGGKVTGRCASPPCSAGNEQEFDRPAAPAFFGAFQLGWGFNRPPPKYPESRYIP